MALPHLVIVGRPNVGKSSLFNRIVGRDSAIVGNIPGITRDRNYMEAEWEGSAFVAVDTGGFYADKDPDIERQVREQASFAIEEADLIILLLDGKEGLTPLDIEMTVWLRDSGKMFLFVVNKVDSAVRQDRLYDFYRLGPHDLIPVSAQTGFNFDELMDKVVSLMPPKPAETTHYPMVAVVGRPNVGKSTLINSLLGRKRLIVSPLPGTTRDSIDSVCTYFGKKYLFIDTAGIRRKSRGYPVERFAMLRAMESIKRADVSLLLIDATEGIVADDQKIAGMVLEYGKGAVLLFNKWDLINTPEDTYKKLLSTIGRKLWFLAHAPVLTVSALQKKRITKIFPIINEVLRKKD